MTINRRKFLLLLAVMALPMAGCSDTPTYDALPKDSIVVALGDSLTYGYGASPESAYPQVLAQKTGWTVINAGVNGDTSADVLARLDAIIQQNPDLVLLGVGGNDVLQRVQPDTTQANLIQTVTRLQAKDIEVMLIAEPHFSASALFGKASDNPIYAEVSEELDVPLFTGKQGSWSDILSDESLKSDKIHANDAGYQTFAHNLYGFLQDIGYAD